MQFRYLRHSFFFCSKNCFVGIDYSAKIMKLAFRLIIILCPFLAQAQNYDQAQDFSRSGNIKSSHPDFELLPHRSNICYGESEPAVSLCNRGGSFPDSIGIVWSLSENGGSFVVIDTLYYDSLPAYNSCLTDRGLSHPFDSSKSYNAFVQLYYPDGSIDSNQTNDSLSFSIQIFQPLPDDVLGPDTILCDTNRYELLLPPSLSNFIWGFPFNTTLTKSLIVFDGVSVPSKPFYNYQWRNVQYSNQGGCENRDTVLVLFGNAKYLGYAWNGPDTNICDTASWPITYELPWFAKKWLWNGNDSVSQFLQMMDSGSLSLLITDSLGCSASTQLRVRKITCATEISEAAYGEKTLLYPNPSTGSVELQWSLAKQLELSLYDLQGREILHLQSSGPAVQLDLQHFSSGNYILEVRSKDVMERFKLVLE